MKQESPHSLERYKERLLKRARAVFGDGHADHGDRPRRAEQGNPGEAAEEDSESPPSGAGGDED